MYFTVHLGILRKWIRLCISAVQHCVMNLIQLLSIVYTAITIYLVNIPDEPKSSITLYCNLTGGLIPNPGFYTLKIIDVEMKCYSGEVLKY